MTEQVVRELVEEYGFSEEDALLRLQDQDLWLLNPATRFDDELQGEEGVRLWEEAVQVSRTVADAVSNGPGTIQANAAITQLVWDAAARAEETLRRARMRAGYPEMRNTAFGKVLAELLEKRGLPVTPFRVGELAEKAGLDGWKVINRMASADAEDAGKLDGLADELRLDQREEERLARAYAMEEEIE